MVFNCDRTARLSEDEPVAAVLPGLSFTSVAGTLGLIRFGGHLSGYGVPDDRRSDEKAEAGGRAQSLNVRPISVHRPRPPEVTGDWQPRDGASPTASAE